MRRRYAHQDGLDREHDAGRQREDHDEDEGAYAAGAADLDYLRGCPAAEETQEEAVGGPRIAAIQQDSVMDRYAEVWERFEKERRLEFGGHTDPDWRDGHAISASFIVPVDAGRLRERLEPLRDALGRFPFVTLHPDRFLHITLLFLGFLAEEPEGPGEISHKRLREMEAEARAALRGFPAFPMRLANLNAFPGAVFVEAHDGGMLGRLREAICYRCGLDVPSGPPHLTLGYVHAPDGSPAPEDFVDTLRRYRDWPVGDIQVEEVQVTLLDLGREYPSPYPVASIPLDG